MAQNKINILVAGGTGMVGSAIIRGLLKKDYLNIHATYHKKNQHSYQETLIGKKGLVKWYSVDLIDRYEVQSLFDNIQPEWVILAAAKVGGIVANNKYRAEFLNDNLMIQNNVVH